jgi:hypothetical protein
MGLRKKSRFITMHLFLMCTLKNIAKITDFPGMAVKNDFFVVVVMI